MRADASCGCDTFVHPAPTANPPGLPVIRYRAGDFLAFRHALLLARPGELALAAWRPGAYGDLAVQLVEWWAVLADILTFYNERVLSQAFLRTADLPEAVRNLVRLLGYRPRPGIAAHGEIAAIVSAKLPLTLRQGFPLQSKGKTPQIFETDADTILLPGGITAADPAPGVLLFRAEAGGRASVLLAGTVTSAAPGDRLLLRRRAWTHPSQSRIVTVRGVAREVSPRGAKNTRVTFEQSISPTGDRAADWILLRPTQTARLFSTAASPIADSGNQRIIHLEGTAAIAPNDALLLDGPLGISTARVTGVAREVWYANAKAATPESQPVDPTIPIPILHVAVRCMSGIDTAGWNAQRTLVTASFGWSEVGTLIGTPRTIVPSIADAARSGGPVPLTAPRQGILEDAHGIAQLVGAGSVVPVQTLTVPLQFLTNLVSVSRGKSVPREVLGSGDASIAGQSFVLAKSPLTYLQRGEGYASTLRIRVDGIEWQEKPSFFGQSPDARVFVTREDAEQITHVLFGDGIEGSRLPSGRDNVVASYRHGSGDEVPAPGSLSVMLKPEPGIRGVRSPLVMGGGADPDPPDKIRRYAPATMLALGRAVSGSDYESIAAQAPGVRRVRAYWSFDAAQQRSRIAIYAGDTAGAVDAARTAVLAARDPNREVNVLAATPRDLTIDLTIAVRGDHDPERVEADVRRALADDDAGLLGANVVRIGQVFFDSHIHRACLAVPGVVAVRALAVLPLRSSPYAPEEGEFFRLAALTVATEVA